MEHMAEIFFDHQLVMVSIFCASDSAVCRGKVPLKHTVIEEEYYFVLFT